MPSIYYSNCPVCGSEQQHTVFKVKDYTVSGEVFAIAECADCTLRFTQGVPDQGSIGPYYKSEDYISHTNTSKGIISKLYQAVRTRTMKQKAGIIKKFTQRKTGRLLDLGCGTGTFLNTMKGEGWMVAGLEPDADARALAKTLYGLEVAPAHALYHQPENFYDAITLWHVLEHVHELQAYVAQLGKSLKPDGVLFIAVPNYTSKDAAVYQQYWAAYDVPRHLYHFSPKAMETLMAVHGLTIADYLPMWFDSFYVDMLSSKYKSGTTQFIGSGLHGLSSNLNAIGNAKACSSVIYVIRKQG